MNRRRKLLTALAAAALVWTPVARAQPTRRAGKPMRVAFLSMGSGHQIPEIVKTVIDTLSDLGWVEGRDIAYDIVYAQSDRTRLSALAAELVGRKPDLIHVMANPESLAVLNATRSIPIVFGVALDPVEAGLVQSLNRPGGNVTGVATLGRETAAKRMQLLKETMPKIRRVAVLMSSSPLIGLELKTIEQSAGPGIKVIAATANEPGELETAFASLADSRPEAMIVTQVAFYIGARKRILGLTGKLGIPLIATRSDWVDDGALMSYNASRLEQVKRSAQLADRILKGAKPADIPVEQPTKFDLVVNLKTAKAFGLTIPQALLLQASRVIE
jgi:putative tryptophan/tyrosine transport system substrate-binding protein